VEGSTERLFPNIVIRPVKERICQDCRTSLCFDIKTADL